MYDVEAMQYVYVFNDEKRMLHGHVRYDGVQTLVIDDVFLHWFYDWEADSTRELNCMPKHFETP